MQHQQLHGKEVCVMYVSSLGNFSVITVEDLENLEMIQSDINSSAFRAKLMEAQKQEGRPIQTGDKVLARFTDGKLYRAEIVRVEGADFKVFYSDFGNVGNSREVYHIPESLEEIPGFSIRCSLSCSIEDEEKASKEFARSIQAEPGCRLVLQVLKVKEAHLEVDLVKVTADGMVSIRDNLVFLGLAGFAPVDGITVFPNIFRKRIQNHQLDLNVGEIHKGFVGHIPFVHPGNWVQISVMVSSAVPVYRLPRLMEKMQRTYSHPSSEALWGLGGLSGMVDPGIVCAAQDQQDGKWYRAVVLSRLRGRIYTVRYVDFGEKKILSVYSLRRLFPEFRDALPELARTVSIPVKIATDIQARKVHSALKQILLNKVVGFEVREVRDNLMLVDMDCEGEEIKEVVEYLKI